MNGNKSPSHIQFPNRPLNLMQFQKNKSHKFLLSWQNDSKDHLEDKNQKVKKKMKDSTFQIITNLVFY
jgi:hypothetical protein